jgi:hypothetical protein
MPTPASTSHLICWRSVEPARRYRITRETAHATNSASMGKNARPPMSNHAGGGPKGRSRSSSGGRNGVVSNAPYAWTSAVLTNSVGGTHRHRRDGR